MKKIRRKPISNREMFIHEIDMPRSPYKKSDCCYRCPYIHCPSRPLKPFEIERPRNHNHFNTSDH